MHELCHHENNPSVMPDEIPLLWNIPMPVTLAMIPCNKATKLWTICHMKIISKEDPWISIAMIDSLRAVAAVDVFYLFSEKGCTLSHWSARSG